MDNEYKRKRSPKIALNKSASFSGSPLSEKIEIKQLFKSKDGDTYLRQYSYEVTGRRRPHHNHKYSKASPPKTPLTNSPDYFFTPYEGGITKKESNFQFGTPFKYLFTFAKHINEEKGFANTLTENVPMEIDKSHNDSTLLKNNNEMKDVHENDNNQLNHKSKVPKLLIKPKKSIEVIKSGEQKKTVKQVKSGGRFLFRLIKLFFLFFVPVFIGVFFMHNKIDSNLVKRFDSEPIVNELRKLVYGQEKVINSLEYNLNIIKNNKVFVFTGGTGVGKTYTAKIIEKNFPYKNNVQKIYPSSIEHYRVLEKRIESNLERNSQNLIVMDSLTLDDIFYILPIINNLFYIPSKFIIILIFNLQDDSLNPIPINILKSKSEEISKIFYDNNVSHSTFVFENLNENDAKECIKFQMREKNMVVDDIYIDSVLESINYRYSGCKGVYQKVSLLEVSKSVIKNKNNDIYL